MRRNSSSVRVVGLVGLLVFMACSASRPTENVSSTSQAVVDPIDARVLGFEQPTSDWSASNLSIQSGTQFTQGQQSAAITVSASGGKLTSIALSTLGTVSPIASLQVRLPSYLANQSWQGQLALFLNAPSAGVYSQ